MLRQNSLAALILLGAFVAGCSSPAAVGPSAGSSPNEAPASSAPSLAPSPAQPAAATGAGGAAPASGLASGPASAVVTVGGTSTTMAGGYCLAIPEGFVLTLGGSFYPIDPPLPDFFGITIEGAVADGSFTGDKLVGPLVVIDQKEFAMATTGSITLKDSLTRGEFSGPLENGSGTISGSFSCG
jgi:hypothetical protein